MICILSTILLFSCGVFVLFYFIGLIELFYTDHKRLTTS